MIHNPVRDRDEQMILRAFQGPRNRWRTAGGVARDLRLSHATVTRFIDQHPDLFEQSPISLGGIPIYGLRGAEADRASR